MDADGNKSGGRSNRIPNKATAEVRTLAMEYGPAGLGKLAKLAGLTKDDDGNEIAGAQSEAAQITAIAILIDRAYGRVKEPSAAGAARAGAFFTSRIKTAR